MTRQVLLELGENFKAIQAAEKCTVLDPSFAYGFLDFLLWYGYKYRR